MELTRVGQEKAVRTIHSLSSRLAAIRDRTESVAAKVQHAAVAAGTGYVYGMVSEGYSSRGEVMPTVMGVTPSLVYTVAAFAIAETAGGKIGEALHSATTAMASIAGYEMGKDAGRTSPRPPGRRAASAPATNGY